MRVYIAGPMTGIQDHNYPAFAEAAAAWRAAGHEVVSPAEMNVEMYGTDDHEALAKRPWSTYIRGDLRALLDCDGIVLLPGWSGSKGATLEAHVAEALGMGTYFWHSDPGEQMPIPISVVKAEMTLDGVVTATSTYTIP